MRVRLTADVQPEIEVAPEELTFAAGMPKRVILQFRTGTQADFKIKIANSPAPYLTLTVDAKNQSVEVVYSGFAPATVGDSERSVVIVETNGIEQPLVKIPVTLTKPSSP